MSFKLTKTQIASRADIAERLQNEKDALNTLISGLKEAIEEARGGIDNAIGSYNEVLQEARDFVEEVKDTAQEAWDEKSEKWQEGERGQMAQSFIDAWEGFDANDLDAEDLNIPDPDEIEEAECDEIGEFTELAADMEEC